MAANKNNNSVTLRVQIWKQRGKQIIKIASPESGIISTIQNTPGKRYHPNLFRKLRKVLLDARKWEQE